MPPAHAQVLKELAGIDAELTAIHKGLADKRQKLLQAHLDQREPLLQRRFELVTGKEAPTKDELAGYTGPSAGTVSQSVPNFWLNALCAEEAVARHISKADKGALRYCQDVRYLRGAGGMVLEFHFAADNPYFENRVLRRGLGVEKDASGHVVDVRDDGTTIDWYDGRSLLVATSKVAAKKKKKGKGGHKRRKGKGHDEDEEGHEEGEGEEGEGLVRTKPVPSFFRFFLPLQKPKVVDPTALHDSEAEDDDEPFIEEEEEAGVDYEVDSDGDVQAQARDPHAAAAARKAERDMALLDVIVRRVIPRAVHLYMDSLQAVDEEQDEDGYGVVRPATDINTLPAAAQQALHALRNIQAKLDECCLTFKQSKWAAAKEADEKEQQLLDRRAAALRGAPRQLRHVKGAGGAAAMTSTVPLFWLAALRRGLDDSCSIVARRDEVALASLADVRLRWDWSHMPTREQPHRHATVEWTFLDNPYFKVCTLSKKYTLACDGGAASKLSLTEPGQIITAPQWFTNKPPHTSAGSEGEELPGKCDLTLKGASSTGGNPPPATSFFNLFKKGSLRYAFAGLEPEAGGHITPAAVLAAEEEMLAGLMGGALRYGPCTLYKQADLDEDDLGHEWNEHEEEDEEEEGDEDDEEGTDEDEEGDEGQAAARRRRKSKKSAKGQSWGLSKQQVFIALMLLLALAQFIMYFEMWFR